MKKLRRILSMALCIAMLATMFAGLQMTTVSAAMTGTYGDLTYEISDDNTYVTITDCDKNATSVEIPAKINDLPVTSIGDYAFSFCPNLIYVAIPSGVTQIGYCVFAGSNNLKSLYIPVSVTSIDDTSFLGSDQSSGIMMDYSDTYYEGTEEQWNKIEIISNGIYGTNFPGTIHYNSSMPATSPSPTPTSTPEPSRDPNTLYINADYDKSIKIQKNVSEEADYDGKLKLVGVTANVERDYSQKCSVKVENTTDNAIKYYLTCINPYDDIAVNFVEEGSEDHPLIIQSGETQSVELSIFTQNAELESYELPIYAYIVDDSAPAVTASTNTSAADSKTTVYLNCNQPKWNVSCDLTSSDSVTLAQTYSLTNNGEDITDLYVSVEGDAAEYVKYYPYIANYQLNSNDSISFTLSPDLAKMKSNNLSKLEGTLVVKNGANKDEQSIVFDTNGAEITTTTMGELGLVQNSNPYVNLELDEDSVKSTISVNGKDKTFEEIIGDKDTNDLTADDVNGILGEMVNENTDYCFDVSDSADYTYGENGERVTVVTRIYVTSGDESEAQAAADIIGDGYTYDPETGTVTITDTKKYNSQEYEFWFAELCEKIGGGINIPGTISKIVIPEDHSDFQVHVEKKIISEVWKSATEDVDIVQSINYLNDGLKVYSTVADVVKVGSVVSNPNYDDRTKATYTGLVIAKHVVSAITPAVSAHPVGFFASLIAGYCIDQMIEDMEDSFTLKDGSALYYDVYGSQCTNRGSVSADFYVPDYVSSNNSVELYETGRMYDGGNKYVNNEDTEYYYYLNEDKIGESRNAGLTEVSIAKLPADKLKFGSKNTITRDYLTNPGSHYVTADSEITLIYPNDAEVGYIGSVEGLEDVRLHPDFAIYTENVYLDNETAIVGEANKMSFNVYNRGSQSGWVTVTVTENGNTVFEQENVFIEAFNSSNFCFDWTPSSEKNNIEIKLENKTAYIDERKDTNNYVSKTISARQRQVPEILSVSPAEALAEENICLYSDVNNTDDIKSVYFYVDGVKCEGTSVKTLNEDGTGRYSLIISPLSEGKHTIKAEVEYYTGSVDTALTEKTGEINISADNKINFAVDETIVNPKYTVAKYNEETYEYNLEEAIVSDSENGLKALKLTNSMKKEIDSYRLFVSCDGGFLNMSMSEMSAETKTLSLNNNKELKLNLSSDIVKIDSVIIESIDGIDVDKEIVINGENVYKMQPGIYKLSVNISVTYTSGEYEYNNDDTIYLSDAVDMNGDSTIDLSGYILEYTFAMPNVDFNTVTYANADIIYTIDGETNTNYMNAVINTTEKTISCVDLYRWSIEEIDKASDAILYISIPQAESLYKVNIKNSEIPTELYQKDLVKVNFKTDGKTTIKSLSVINDKDISTSAQSGSTTIYLPKESFDYISTFENSGITYSVKDKFDLSNAESTYDVELKAENYNFATVKFDLPNLAEISKLNYELNNSLTVGWIDITDGQEIMMPIGSVPIEIWYADKNNDSNNSEYYADSFSIETIVNTQKDTENLVSVQNKYDGIISYFNCYDYDYVDGIHIYNGGKEFSVDLSELKDTDGNILESYYANTTDKYLSGTATFTSVSNPDEKYEVAVSGYSMYDVEGVLPNVDGEFTLSVNLSNTGSGITPSPEPGTKYTITAEAGTGGSISPSGATEYTTGENAEYKITADSGYKISDVKVDGTSIGAKSTYIFENISSTHTITATFEKKSSSSGGSGGGGGGGGGSSFVTTSSTPTPAPTATATAAPNTQTTTFTDVPTTHWAYSYIEDLCAAGVVNGNGDGTFTPENNVTRAEFAKMACVLFGLSTDSATTQFTDISASDWYYSYVIAATEAGIVNGTSQYTFSPNDNITREQMAAIIGRYFDMTSTSSLLYADASSIEPYALPYVTALTESGLLTGDNGYFRPADTATRAEAATLLDRVKNTLLGK